MREHFCDLLTIHFQVIYMISGLLLSGAAAGSEMLISCSSSFAWSSFSLDRPRNDRPRPLTKPDGPTDRRNDRQTERRIEGPTNRRTDEPKVRQTWTDSPTDRPTDENVPTPHLVQSARIV